jgi:hypothetical protein
MTDAERQVIPQEPIRKRTDYPPSRPAIEPKPGKVEPKPQPQKPSK